MATAQILVVDDETDIRDMVQEILSEEGYEVSVAANAAEARAARKRLQPDLVLLDIWMPDTDGISLLKEWNREEPVLFPVVMISGHGTVDTAIEATRLGALDYIEKPLSLAKLLRTVEHALEIGRRTHAPAGLGAASALAGPVGKSPVMQTLREQCRRVAPHDTPTLLVGETGSGRENAARYIHALSTRATGPFVDVVFAEMSPADAELRLFGRESGGRIEQGWLDAARQGTLFLNELTDASRELQLLLLGVLEQGGYRRVGGSMPVTLDARIVASALPEIDQRVEDGRFRRDLYMRLAGVVLQVPALRSYLEDVPELLRHYADALSDGGQVNYRRFSVAAQNRLRNYPWPGNLGELRNLVQRFLVLGDESDVSLEEVEAVLTPIAADGPLVKQDLLSLPLREARERFERAYLEQQLKLCGGKVGKVAERAGMERTHLYRKLNMLGIDFRNPGGDESE